MLRTIVQMFISLFLVLILALIGYSTYNTEYINALKNYNTVRKEVVILDGRIDLSKSKDETFDTQDSTKPSFIDLTPSVNQNGGAEYTYNFWLYKDGKSSICTSDYKTLFYRGSDMKVNYTSDNCHFGGGNSKYILVKNPLVRISKDGTKLIVEYNTIEDPDAVGNRTGDCNQGEESNNRRMLGIYELNDKYDRQFIMITIVLKEISSEDDILNKNVTNCKLYLNSTLILDKNVSNTNKEGKTVSTVMKHNKGKFYFNPSIEEDGKDDVNNPKALLLSDITYFNYAIDPPKIEQLFNKGFSDKIGRLSGGGADDTYVKGTKLDIDKVSSPKPY